MRPEAKRLAGLRILIVEDTPLVAEVIADQLEGWGCRIVGPADRVEAALALLANDLPDAALLDVNLGGEFSFQVAELLEEQDVPYIYMSGYDDVARLPPSQRTKPLLGKPFTQDSLLDLLLSAVGPL